MRLRLLLLVLTALAFSPVLGAYFVDFDDSAHLAKNPALQSFAWEGLQKIWTEAYIGLYVPLTYTVWFLLKAVAQPASPAALSGIPELSAFPFHALSLALHLVSVGLVYRIVRRLCRSERGALLGAAVFALHPLQVEAVAWVSALKDTLSTVLAFAALDFYLQSPHRARTAKYIGALALLGLALLAKPSAAALVFMVFVLNYGFLRRDARESARESLPWLVVSLPIMWITAHIQADQVLTGLYVPVWGRPLVALDAMSFYLGKLVLPYPLAIDYGREPMVYLQNSANYLTVLPALGVAALLWTCRRSYPWLVASAALVVAGLVPVLGFKPFSFQELSTVADRYLYLPMLGVAVGLGFVGARVTEWTRPKVGAVAALIVLAATGTLVQATRWHDSVALLTHASAVNPSSWIAENNLASHYEQRADYAPAIAHYLRSAQIRPRWEPYFRAGVMLVYSERWEAARDTFFRAAELAPSDARNYLNLGVVEHQLGHNEVAVTHLQRALQLDANNVQAQGLLAEIRAPHRQAAP